MTLQGVGIVLNVEKWGKEEEQVVKRGERWEQKQQEKWEKKVGEDMICAKKGEKKRTTSSRRRQNRRISVLE